MDNFDIACAVLLANEGGYANDARDRGKETKYGISKTRFPNVDIKNLTWDGAKEIYRVEYWEQYKCSEMPLPIAIFLFDCVVNHSPMRPIMWLQGALGCKPDGVIGPITIKIASLCNNFFSVLVYMATQRGEYYLSMPEYGHFGKGWRARNIYTLAESLRWAK